MRILLVEDEKTLSKVIVRRLAADKIVADAAYTGPDGLDCALTGAYDAVLLDVMLPGMDGFTVLEKLRREKITTPVIMLTARAELEDRIRGLESGADYYLPKPFEMDELIACLHAVTRRKGGEKANELATLDIRLDRKDATVTCTGNGQSIRLSAKEFQLLELFVRNPHRILPHDMIIDRVWGPDGSGDGNSLAVYISFVRKKLEFIGCKAELRASRGFGYALEEKA